MHMYTLVLIMITCQNNFKNDEVINLLSKLCHVTRPWFIGLQICVLF